MATPQEEITRGRQGAPPLTRDDVQDLFNQFLRNRNVSAETGGAQLYGENAELREKNRTLKKTVEEFEGMLPKGAVVLKGDDVKLFNDLKALLTGEQKPDDLAKLIKEHGDLSTKVKDLEKQQVAVLIAEAEGWKASVLQRLTQGMDLVVEDVEEQVDDPEHEGQKKLEKKPHGFIQTRDAAGNVSGKKRLSDELKDFIPSLSKEEGVAGSESGERRGEGDQGTPFVRQSQGGKAAPSKGNVSADFLKNRYKIPGKDEGK